MSSRGDVASATNALRRGYDHPMYGTVPEIVSLPAGDTRASLSTTLRPVDTIDSDVSDASDTDAQPAYDARTGSPNDDEDLLDEAHLLRHASSVPAAHGPGGLATALGPALAFVGSLHHIVLPFVSIVLAAAAPSLVTASYLVVSALSLALPIRVYTTQGRVQSLAVRRPVLVLYFLSGVACAATTAAALYLPSNRAGAIKLLRRLSQPPGNEAGDAALIAFHIYVAVGAILAFLWNPRHSESPGVWPQRLTPYGLVQLVTPVVPPQWIAFCGALYLPFLTGALAASPLFAIACGHLLVVQVLQRSIAGKQRALRAAYWAAAALVYVGAPVAVEVERFVTDPDATTLPPYPVAGTTLTRQLIMCSTCSESAVIVTGFCLFAFCAAWAYGAFDDIRTTEAGSATVTALLLQPGGDSEESGLSLDTVIDAAGEGAPAAVGNPPLEAAMASEAPSPDMLGVTYHTALRQNPLAGHVMLRSLVLQLLWRLFPIWNAVVIFFLLMNAPSTFGVAWSAIWLYVLAREPSVAISTTIGIMAFAHLAFLHVEQIAGEWTMSFGAASAAGTSNGACTVVLAITLLSNVMHLLKHTTDDEGMIRAAASKNMLIAQLFVATDQRISALVGLVRRYFYLVSVVFLIVHLATLSPLHTPVAALLGMIFFTRSHTRVLWLLIAVYVAVVAVARYIVFIYVHNTALTQWGFQIGGDVWDMWFYFATAAVIAAQYAFVREGMTRRYDIGHLSVPWLQYLPIIERSLAGVSAAVNLVLLALNACFYQVSIVGAVFLASFLTLSAMLLGHSFLLPPSSVRHVWNAATLLILLCSACVYIYQVAPPGWQQQLTAWLPAVMPPSSIGLQPSRSSSSVVPLLLPIASCFGCAMQMRAWHEVLAERNRAAMDRAQAPRVLLQEVLGASRYWLRAVPAAFSMLVLFGLMFAASVMEPASIVTAPYMLVGFGLVMLVHHPRLESRQRALARRTTLRIVQLYAGAVAGAQYIVRLCIADVTISTGTMQILTYIGLDASREVSKQIAPHLLVFSVVAMFCAPPTQLLPDDDDDDALDGRSSRGADARPVSAGPVPGEYVRVNNVSTHDRELLPLDPRQSTASAPAGVAAALKSFLQSPLRYYRRVSYFCIMFVLTLCSWVQHVSIVGSVYFLLLVLCGFVGRRDLSVGIKMNLLCGVLATLAVGQYALLLGLPPQVPVEVPAALLSPFFKDAWSHHAVSWSLLALGVVCLGRQANIRAGADPVYGFAPSIVLSIDERMSRSREKISAARASGAANYLARLLPVPAKRRDFTKCLFVRDRMKRRMYTYSPMVVLIFSFIYCVYDATQHFVVAKLCILVLTLVFFQNIDELQWRGNTWWSWLIRGHMTFAGLRLLVLSPIDAPGGSLLGLNAVANPGSSGPYWTASPSDLAFHFFVLVLLFFQATCFERAEYAFFLHYLFRQASRAAFIGCEMRLLRLRRVLAQRRRYVEDMEDRQNAVLLLLSHAARDGAEPSHATASAAAEHRTLTAGVSQPALALDLMSEPADGGIVSPTLARPPPTPVAARSAVATPPMATPAVGSLSAPQGPYRRASNLGSTGSTLATPRQSRSNLAASDAPSVVAPPEPSTTQPRAAAIVAAIHMWGRLAVLVHRAAAWLDDQTLLTQANRACEAEARREAAAAQAAAEIEAQELERENAAAAAAAASAVGEASGCAESITPFATKALPPPEDGAESAAALEQRPPALPSQAPPNVHADAPAVAAARLASEIGSFEVELTSTRGRSMKHALNAMGRALVHFSLAHMDRLCYFAFCLHFGLSPSLVTVWLPLATFIYAAPLSPRPHRMFWNAALVVLQLEIVIKSIIKVATCNADSTAVRPNDPASFSLWTGRMCMPGSFFVVDLFTALACVVCVTIHKRHLMSSGLWHDRELSVETTQKLLTELERRDGDEAVTAELLNVGSRPTFNPQGGEQRGSSESLLERTKQTAAEVRANICSVDTKPGVTYYRVCFTIDLVVFITVFLGYYKLTGEEDNIVNSLQYSVLPGNLTLCLFAMFALISLDRVVLLRRSMPYKYALTSASAILFHALMLYWFQGQTRYDVLYFNDSSFDLRGSLPLAVSLYLLKAVNLFFSCRQISGGPRPYNDHICFAGTYSNFELVVYLVSRAVPFVFDLRTLLDWTVTPTVLKMNQWIRVEDIAHELYMVKSDIIDNEDVDKFKKDGPVPKNAQPFPRLLKYAVGPLAFVGVALVLLGPLLIYSTFSPAMQSNPVRQISASVALLSSPPFWQMTEAVPAESTLNDTIVTLIERTRAGIVSYGLSQSPLQVVQFAASSSNVWVISPPALAAMQQQLLQQAVPLALVMQLQITTQSSSTSSSNSGNQLLTQRRELEWEERLELVEVLAGNRSGVQLDYAISPFVFDRGSSFFAVGSGTSNMVRCRLNLTRGSGDASSYFNWGCGSLFDLSTPTPDGQWGDLSAREWACLRNDQCDDEQQNDGGSDIDGMYLVIQSAPYLGISFLQSIGIVAAYTTFVLAIGRVLRFAFTGGAYRLPIEEMEDPHPIIAVVQMLYMARARRDFLAEGRAYRSLVDTLRQTERLERVTRVKKRQ